MSETTEREANNRQMKERDELIEEARKGIDDGEYDTFNDPDQAMADFALKHFGIYREICEAAESLRLGDWLISNNGNPAKLISLRQFDGNGNVLSYTHHETIPEAFEFVKGTETALSSGTQGERR